MSDVTRFVRELSGAQQAMLGLGLALIIALAGVLGWWAFRAPYAVLFSDLVDQDAGAIIQELDKLKVPYQISPNGQAILVPEASVHKTRMTLMGRQLPLHGAVGFELFNNTDFGVSDFVQKVNYQRALQGELTRTIASLEQVLSARVHLALPEQGLFRKDAAKAKASVTVVTKPGQALAPGQVLGIQRLVGASVAEVRPEDVTVLDQRGVTLSRTNIDDASSSIGSGAQFDSKFELESYLARKAAQVLDEMFGKGSSLVTVDVLLNTQQTKVTTEEVLAATNLPKDQAPTGVIVRERTVTRDTTGDGGKSTGPLSTSQEMDYATGKRTEQVILPSGTVSRVNVAVVVKNALSSQELARVREVVAASVGAQPNRGDVVAVYSLEAVQDAAKGGDAAASPPNVGSPDLALHAGEATAANEHPQTKVREAFGVVVAALLVLLAWPLIRRYLPKKVPSSNLRPPLTEGERQSVLKSVQAWLAVPERRHEG